MKKVIALCVLFCLIGGLVAVAAEAEKEPATAKEAAKELKKAGRPDAQTRPGGPGGESRPNDSMRREKMLERMKMRRTEMHAAEIADWVAVKKIAEEEGATKTVEAIQAVIDKKNAEFKERLEKSQARERERGQRPAARPDRRNPNASPRTRPETPAEEK